MQTCLDPNCPYARRAKEAALEAIETAGGAVAIASSTHTMVDALASEVHELKSKVSLATVISGAMGATAIVVAAVLGYLAVMAPSRVTVTAQEVAKSTAESVLRQQMQTTETITADAARRGADLALEQFVTRQPPAPIARQETISAKPKQR